MKHTIKTFVFIVILAAFCFCKEDEKDLVIDCSLSSLSINLEKATKTSCGASNGVILVSALGGKGKLSFSIEGSNFGETREFKDLAMGSYEITVMDEQQCRSSLTVTMDCKADITLDIINITAARCGADDGSFEAKATGGTGNYQYKIENGDLQPHGQFGNLEAGSYLLTVNDTHNCKASTKVNITEEAKIAITEIISSGTSSCNAVDGSLLVMVEGGDGHYEYKLDETDFGPGNEFKNLTSKTYTLTVRDGKGCSVTQTVNIAERNELRILSIDGTPPGCDVADGTLTIEAAGTYEIIVMDGTGCSVYENHQIFSDISYFSNIKPLITRGCVADECHAGKNELLDMTDLEAIREGDSLIIEKIVNGNPISKNGTLTEDEVKMITCWLEDGAPDN
ncbi:SprB repeat-containing protein [Fulvivirgaceae bacterium BMA12]|uniref:SprB repeat-containing protein n=1 Tax=Agaribacillus aureus TaxID=3051825 RepID=A0ABT8L7D8_9BACT|nr:SprB repeat-containing protein [Fulvivirgaceae bacterium BMA12]